MITNKHAQVLYQENMKWELNFAGGGVKYEFIFCYCILKNRWSFPHIQIEKKK